MTPFETQLIQDMKLFGYSQRTQDTYLYVVRKLCAYVQKPVEQITNEELRGYLLWHKDNYAPNCVLPPQHQHNHVNNRLYITCPKHTGSIFGICLSMDVTLPLYHDRAGLDNQSISLHINCK